MLSRFWSEYFWLPANTTWADISNGSSKSVVYAEAKDFWVQIPLIIFSLTLRFLSERYMFRPLGRYLQIRDFKRNVPPNPKLEAAFLKSPTIRNASALAKQLDLSERQIERWWRLRRSQDKPSTLVKFCENMWKGFFFMFNVSLGLYVVWGQEWVRDVDMTFHGYPHQYVLPTMTYGAETWTQEVVYRMRVAQRAMERTMLGIKFIEGISPEIWWFYMIASSFYFSLIITQFRDVRRKDFWQMFIHHIATIGLLYFSWVCQCYRIGCLVLILHDMGDIFLEFGKAAKYANYQRTVDCIFALFVCVWVVTRLVLIPFYVLPTAFAKLTYSPMIFVMNILLVLLFVLSLLWTWLIFKIVRKTITAGQFGNDDRSSNSEESDVSISNGVSQGKNVHIAPAPTPRRVNRP